MKRPSPRRRDDEVLMWAASLLEVTRIHGPNGFTDVERFDLRRAVALIRKHAKTLEPPK